VSLRASSGGVARSAPRRITELMQKIAGRAAENDAPQVLSELMKKTQDSNDVDVCTRWCELYGPAVTGMLDKAWLVFLTNPHGFEREPGWELYPGTGFRNQLGTHDVPISNRVPFEFH